MRGASASPVRAPGAPAAEPQPAAAPTEEKPKPSVPKFLTKEEKKKLRAARLRKLRRKRQLAEEKRRAEEEAEAERKRLQELADRRWHECLTCLRESVPVMKKNPWLLIQEPLFIHNYLDSLTDTLSNLASRQDDLETVRVVLQDVYECFVDLGRFARTQPAFFIGDPDTIKRLITLLQQVAHRGSDKALFPNVIQMLLPTFEREECHDVLADARVSHPLMSWARNDWKPTPGTLATIFQVFDMLSASPRIRGMVMDDPGWPKLMAMTFGQMEGFTEEQQLAAQRSLRRFFSGTPPTASLTSLPALPGHSASQPVTPRSPPTVTKSATLTLPPLVPANT